MLKAGTAARRRSLHWNTPQPPDTIRQQVNTLLHGINEHLIGFNEQWIGHVKILIAGEDQTSYGSITAAHDQPHWAGALSQPITNAELTIYAAIYGLSDAQVAQAVDQTLHAELGIDGWGLAPSSPTINP